MSASTSTRITYPPLLRLRAVSNVPTRSSASSSISRRLSRVIWKIPRASTSKPGKRESMWWSITFSRGTNRVSGPGILMNRSTCGGTSTRPFMRFPSSPRLSCTAYTRLPLRMTGKGWAGSMASGERTGKSCVSNHEESHFCPARPRLPGDVMLIPASRQRESSFLSQACWRSRSERTFSLMASSCRAGVRPSALLSATPAMTCPTRPATLTM